MRSVALAGCLVFICSLLPLELSAQLVARENGPSSAIDQLPLVFEPNRGQTDSQFAYLSRANSYTVYLGPTRAVWLLRLATRSAPRALSAWIC
jgi:hypothetical protein